MHKPLPFSLLLLLGSLCCSNLYAADMASPENIDWQQECQRVKNIQPPKEDEPSKELRDSVSGCDSERLYYSAKYYSKTTLSDWEKVRACAIMHDNNGILAMLYANGLSVKRNYNLAMKYLCSSTDMDQMTSDLGALLKVEIEWLAKLRDSKSEPDKPYELCDFAATTIEESYCFSRGHLYRQGARNRELDDLSTSWSEEQKVQFARMREALLVYSSARGSLEIDQTGSGRYIYSAAEEEAQETGFMNDMLQIEKHVYPSYTQTQFDEFDRALNQRYRYILTNMVEGKSINGFSPVTKAGIRETEKLWLNYRDAWVAFGKVRYPTVPAHAWKAMLTERRIKDLEDLKEMVDGRARGK